MFKDIQNHFTKILRNIRGQGKITEDNISDSMRDVRRALLEADVNFNVVKNFINRVAEKASGDTVFDSIKPGQQFIKIILDELKKVLGGSEKGISFGSPMTIVVVAGLQGAGKTTTSVKLANYLKNKHSKNPCLIAADLQRPAAIDQLEIFAKLQNIPVYYDKSSSAIHSVKSGLMQCKSNKHDLVIIDTAGRLNIDSELMNELKDIIDFCKPNEVLYVADSMTGQDAVESSKAFNDIVEVSGVILTKADGDSRGGAAISIVETINKHIKFIGFGEKVSDLEVFDPERMAKRILGMGDVVGLVEKAKEVFDEKEALQMQEKLKKNNFDFNDFKLQIKQIKKMGPIKDLIGMIPGVSGKFKALDMDDNKIKWVEAIINSMTKSERENPSIMDGSRRKRVAKGSGRSMQEVNQLLKQFLMMKNMMKKMNKRGKLNIPI
ncbi:MAG: signal recognition particle protein [Candidatus Marinimicrobia bacterium]|nr:signal recognition particle protein [Candidatus Neomarinimicrobiota bacterium]|tara:strand:+ start:2577 stop:3884 length:1308 start_codon:yes stop_codon:yes gene_type:complete